MEEHCLLACSPSYSTQNHQPGVEPPSVGWSLSYQLSSKKTKTATEFLVGQFNRGIFSIGSLIAKDSGLCQVDRKLGSKPAGFLHPWPVPFP